MIGKYVKIIGPDDFILGMTSSPATQDGGYSNEIDNVNITAVPGVLYAPALYVNKSLASSGNIIASCACVPTLTHNRMFVTDTGKYLSWNGTTLVAEATDNTGGVVYQSGTTDMVPYLNNIYTTTAGSSDDANVTQWNGASTLDKVWWVTTSGQTPLRSGVRHPMLVYSDNKLYIADLNKLYSYDGTTNTTVITQALTLPVNWIITALGIDPGSGKMLVGVSLSKNYSSQKSTYSFIGSWNAFDPVSFQKQIPVDDQINAFYNVGGTVYVSYGQTLGYFTGTGIAFVRKLKNVTFAGQALAYKHHFTNLGQRLYVIDGTEILAYGDVILGKKAFSYAFLNPLTSDKFDVVCNIGSNLLGLAYTGGVFLTLDTSSTASITPMTFYSKRYYFDRPMFIRQIITEFDNSLGVSSIFGSLYVINENQTATKINDMQNTGANVAYKFISKDASLKVSTCQIKIMNTNFNLGIRRILVYYDVAE